MPEKPAQRRTYRLKTKREAVALAAATSPFAAARELRIPDSTVRAWCHRDSKLAPIYEAERTSALQALSRYAPDAIGVLHGIAIDKTRETRDRVGASRALISGLAKLQAVAPEDVPAPERSLHCDTCGDVFSDPCAHILREALDEREARDAEAERDGA